LERHGPFDAKRVEMECGNESLQDGAAFKVDWRANWRNRSGGSSKLSYERPLGPSFLRRDV